MKKERNLKLFFTPSVCLSLFILLCVVGGAVFAHWLAPMDPTAISLKEALQGPSSAHWLGTDQTGRDILSRLIYGGRTTLAGALGVVLLASALGLPLGLLAGYYGGWFDRGVRYLCDIIISFPSLLLAFVLVAVFGRNLGNSVIAIGIIYVPMTAKLTRSLTITEKNKTYVEAARTVGYSGLRIMFTEILPNCIPSLMAQLTLDLGYAILDLAAMSFIGLGVQPPTPDWGAMLEEGQALLFSHPMIALAPGILIAVTVVAINMLSDGVLRYLDPTQRRLPRSRRRRAEALAARKKEDACE